MAAWKNIALLTMSPRVGWEEVEASGIETERVMSSAYYPLLALLSVSCFVPMIYDHNEYTLSGCLIDAIIAFAKYLVSYFIASYLLSGFYPELTKSKLAVTRLNNFILYSSVFLIVPEILINVMPGRFAPLYFLMVFSLLVAYRGLDHLGVKKGKRTKFFIIAACLIAGMPVLLSYLFHLLIN